MGDGALPGVTAVVALVLTAALPALAEASRRWRLLLAAAAGAAVLVGAVAALAPARVHRRCPAAALAGALPRHRRRRNPLGGGLDGDPAAADARVQDDARALPLGPGPRSVDGFRASSRGAAAGAHARSGDLVGERRARPRAAALAAWGADRRLLCAWRPPRSGAASRAKRCHCRRRPNATSGRPVENVTLPAEGTLVELTFAGTEPVELHVYDVQPGLAHRERAAAERTPRLGGADRPRRPQLVSRRVRRLPIAEVPRSRVALSRWR